MYAHISPWTFLHIYLPVSAVLFIGIHVKTSKETKQIKAALQRDPDQVRQYLKERRVKGGKFTFLGNELFKEAAKQGWNDLFREMLDDYAAFFVLDTQQCHYIARAAIAANNAEALKMILDWEPEARKLQGSRGYTLLMATADNNSIACAKVLLARGINKNAVSKKGQTAADIAEANGFTELADLIDNDPD